MSPQQTIAHYRIIAKLGEGGMGEVWRATDTKLNREVAIKILPEAFANDADRMVRFTREAQVVASLNHPNIAAIYGVEERALVMELVEGPTLAERIAQGSMPLDDALPIAKQIAEALEYAHERGVIHRDLKPANIKITRDGKVKVLDFGLAKIHTPAMEASPEKSPTLTLEATRVGVVLGTAAYMAPEQAKGRPADKRCDIWSFGVVLYELITGERPFAGETISETLAAVLKTEVDLSRVSVKARRLLGACLEKDPKRRLRDIGDAWRLLEEPSAPAARSRMAKSLPWVIAGLVVMALGVQVLRRPASEAPRRVTLSLLPPENGTFYWNAPPAVSPDGRSVAFGAVVEGRSGIWVRELDSAAAGLCLKRKKQRP